MCTGSTAPNPTHRPAKIGEPFGSAAQIGTRVPSSTTALPGSLKKSTTPPALWLMAANRRSRQRAHATAGRGHHGLAAEEVAGLEHRDAQAVRLGERQGLGHVGRVHETEVQRDAPEAVAQRLHLHPLVHRHPRHLVELHGEDHVALVQHLVVLEVVQQRLRHGARVGHRIHRGALGAVHGLAGPGRR